MTQTADYKKRIEDIVTAQLARVEKMKADHAACGYSAASLSRISHTCSFVNFISSYFSGVVINIFFPIITLYMYDFQIYSLQNGGFVV